MQPRWLLSHARGYIELGLLKEATAELAQLPPDSIDGDEALALRMEIFRAQSRWLELRVIAGELTRRQPANADAWITFAYATRRAESLHAAEAILRAAELRHPREPTIQFNLGCYACQRGDLAEARRRRKAGTLNQLRFKFKRSGPTKMIDGRIIVTANRGTFVARRIQGKQALNRPGRLTKHTQAIEAVSIIDVPQMFNTRRISQRVQDRISKEFPIEFEGAARHFAEKFGHG